MFWLLLLAICAIGINANLGIDYTEYVTENHLNCLAKQGNKLAFINVYKFDNNGSFVETAGKEYGAVLKAGLSAEVYMVPNANCSKPPAQQMTDVWKGMEVSGISSRKIWIQVKTPYSWPVNTTANALFFKELVNRATALSYSVGVYTNIDDWVSIMGSSTIGSKHPLWYWNVVAVGDAGESPQNFDDFKPFGGWSSPTVKQFGVQENICGTVVNRDYYVSA